ncbi:unnamed protein product [Colias eurytheme]|nr:unnamed protein product [Colias eurytheme]
MKDDDEEEDNTFGVTRYPCMPSLVALQQMRNRLHLAFLGRKLMKWTMLASGRELRRLAGELDALYKGFADDLSNAFILLARCRYFYPHLNQMVIEDVPKKAGVIVIPSTKAVSGVKVILHDIMETEAKPYVHLGIEKGGQTILETKKAWLELLKRLIMMMSVRSNFIMVELSNKAATKKQNVLGKIVIPKTNVTMGYINNELEELAREEFFRLKKVLDIKRKIRAAKEDKTEKPKIEQPKKPKVKRKITPLPPVEDDTNRCSICGNVIKDIPLEEDEKALQEQKLEDLKAQINEIMQITKGLNEEGVLATNINDFLRTAEELREQIRYPDEMDFEDAELEIDIDTLCCECRMKYLEERQRKTAKAEEAEPLKEPPVISPVISQTEVTMKEPSKDTFKSARIQEPGTSEVYSQIQSDIELGTFETEEKEIIKITRTKNEDGTISEQKKVIKIKREVKTPVRGKSAASTNISTTNQPSQTSDKSNPYSGSRTVGVISINSNDKSYFNEVSKRQVKSLPITPVSQMSEPVERFCMSSVTLLSTDLDIELNTSSDEYISISLNNSHPAMPGCPKCQYVRTGNSQSCVSFNLKVSENEVSNKKSSISSKSVNKSRSHDELTKTKAKKNKIKESVSFAPKEIKSNTSI